VANAGTTYHQYGYVTGRADGLLASMTDAETSTWTYTTAGAMLTQQQNISGVQRNLSFTRDSVGRPLTLTYPSGMVVSTGYTKDVVASMTVKPAGASAASTLLSGVSYLPFTQAATAWTWGNAQAFSRSFDGNGRITAVKLGTHQRSYAYDAAGRVQTQTDVVAGVTNSITNGYDEAGHLISYVPAGGVAQTFTYDVNGNRKTDSVNGITHTYTINTNRLVAVDSTTTYQYNADGTPSFDGHLLYSYDVFGRLTTATDNTSVYVGYAYNGLGQRVQKTVKSNVGCGGGGGGGNPMRAGGATGTTTNGTTTKGSGATGSVAPPCNPWLVRSTMRYVVGPAIRLQPA
jgi:YD repeat-containing protein